MDFETAKKLMRGIREADKALVALASDIETLDEPDRSVMKRGLAMTMMEMYEHLYKPIGEQHPVLDPVHNRDDESLKKALE